MTKYFILIGIAFVLVLLIMAAASAEDYEKQEKAREAAQPPHPRHWMELANERWQRRQEDEARRLLLEERERREAEERNEWDRKYRAAGLAMYEGRDVCRDCLTIEPDRCYCGHCTHCRGAPCD